MVSKRPRASKPKVRKRTRKPKVCEPQLHRPRVLILAPGGLPEWEAYNMILGKFNCHPNEVHFLGVIEEDDLTEACLKLHPDFLLNLSGDLDVCTRIMTMKRNIPILDHINVVNFIDPDIGVEDEEPLDESFQNHEDEVVRPTPEKLKLLN
jgi:hypothetical protein